MLAAALMTGAAAGACSASLNFIECSDDAECNTRFPSDGPLRCQTGVCVLAECKGHGECSSLGESYACGVDGLCIDVATDACELLHVPGGEIVDEVVFVGAIYDQKAADGPEIRAAIKLAVEEFNSKTTLTNGSGVALIGCDAGKSVEGALSAARHLGETVGAPALIGPADDEEFVAVVEKVSNKSGNLIFTISPTAIAPFADAPDWVWLSSPAVDFYGQAMIDRIAGYQVKTGVMVFSGDNYGIGLRNAISVDNGMGGLVIPNVADQVNLSYDAVNTDGTEALSLLLEGIAEPELVVLIGGDEVGAQIKFLAGLVSARPKKILITRKSVRAVQAALLDLADPDLAGRIELVSPDATDPTVAAAVQGRILAKNSSLNAIGESANLAYDAAMTTLLALRALKSSEPIAGPQIGQKIKRLTEGMTVSFDDDSLAFITAAASEFDLGRNVDLAGASGGLGYNDVVHATCGPFVLWKYDPASSAPVPSASYATNCPAKGGVWADL
ncbi:MAG: ABC transporter substrate-binding protein [Nannocystaceae bacterium]